VYDEMYVCECFDNKIKLNYKAHRTYAY
jgi:hypothetical protein